MLNKVHNTYIPIMTSEAGLCLTSANWQEIKIQSMSFYLAALLIKPGYELLKKIPNLAHYLGWPGAMILNASQCIANKQGIITFTSPYDGSQLSLTDVQLIELIQHIKPEAVLLPPSITKRLPNLWDNWNEAIKPFVLADDLLDADLDRVYGVYFNWNQANYSPDVVEQLKKWTHLPNYIISHNHWEHVMSLRQEGVLWIESNEPARLAMQGIVLTQKGRIQLSEKACTMQFDIIENHCACPTCSQKLTKSYLHHLYFHTPLLCQRLLIQHNVYYAQNYIRN